MVILAIDYVVTKLELECVNLVCRKWGAGVLVDEVKVGLLRVADGFKRSRFAALLGLDLVLGFVRGYHLLDLVPSGLVIK